MKRLISILVITAMLLASVMAMIPAFADEIETPKAPTEYTYNVDWKALYDAKLMKAQCDDIDKGTGDACDFETIFNITDISANTLATKAKTDAELASGVKNEERSYFSTKMYDITDTTYYEYVIDAKNNCDQRYAGVIFAYYNDRPYILYGSFNNTQDNEMVNGNLRGDSVIRGVSYGFWNGFVDGTDDSFLKLKLDNGYGSVKIVYDGYDVSVYGFEDDGADGVWTKWSKVEFTLPEGAKVCFGIYNRDGGASGNGGDRSISVKDAVITAKGRESAAILAGASKAKIALAAALDAAYNVILTDYTEASVEVFNVAIADAEAIFTDATKTDEDFAAAKEAVETALVIKPADKSGLVEAYTTLKYGDNSEYNLDEVALLLAEAEAAMENKSILQSEVDAIVDKMAMISKLAHINSAADFANMDPNGSYILMEDIEITAAYGEFKGYLDGNGKTITVNDCGVFSTLNGATVFDFTIDGSITGTSHVGALATNAKGDVAITNVINNATVTVNSSNKNVAGFIGQGQGANITFKNCLNNADIIGGRTAGFYANTSSGTNNLYFYGCVNNGDISCGSNVIGNPAAGFVARTTDGTTKDVVFEYCANFGDINAKYSAGAFVGSNRAQIKMYGCVVDNTTVTAQNNASHMRPVGGVIGGSNNDDGTVNVEIENCYFDVDVNVTQIYSGRNVALVVGGVTGTVSIKNTVAKGSVTSVYNNTYKLTSNTDATIENCIIDVTLAEGAVDTTANTDMTAFTEDSLIAYNMGVSGVIAAFTRNADIETKIAAVEKLVAGLEGLVTKLELARADALAKLGDKIAADGYTEDSYAAYEAKYAEIVAAINAATTVEEVEAIVIADAKAAAEDLLLTPDEAAALALQTAKDAKLTEIEATKRAADIYTAESYDLYIADVNALIASINGAADLAAVEAIDVAAAMTAAEVKLVTKEAAATAALKAAKNEKLAELGDKIAPDGYTIDSYAAYEAKYAEIVAAINSATTVEKLEAVDLTAADTLLVTQADADAAALQATKDAKLAEIEAAKKAADIYTTDSYDLYISDVNDLIASINNAADLATVEAIDVAAGMIAAEDKLVTKEAATAAALKAAKDEKLAELGSAKLSNEYTAESYSSYKSAYNKIVEDINNADDMSVLNSIDVSALKIEAEAKLVTLEEQAKADAEAAAAALAMAKAKKLTELGKKISADYYTEESYAEYEIAYNAIVIAINDADDEAALNLIDVVARKAIAESVLVTKEAAAAAALKAAKDEKLAELGSAKLSNEYTAESYSSYKSAYNKIVEDINNADDMSVLNAIDVSALKIEAEAKLVTLEEQAKADAETAAVALAMAKAKKLAELGKKISADHYTEESYAEYENAYNAIVIAINDADNEAALNLIDVAALKVAAENKLAVNVPAAPEAPDADNKDDDNKNDDNKNEETDKVTEENKDDNEDSDDEKDADKLSKFIGLFGCKSTVSISALSIIGIIGTAIVFKKKEK